MTEKTLKARFQQKTDTSENWALATNFIPKKGEIIVYSDLDQIKVGDGVTKVNDLHFVSAVDQVFTKTSKLAQSGVAIEDAIAGRKIDKDTKGEVFNDYTNNKAEGVNSHAEGQYTEASGDGAHAEGIGTASVTTSASGKGAHAEGNMTKASGRYSHTEGSETRASGKGAHAEGAQSKASGTSAHAEGDSTQAIEAQSHAEGYGGIAAGKYSHIEGRYVSTSLHDPSVPYVKFSYVYKDENTKYVEYIAIQDVPAGIELDNGSYWQVSGTYSESSHVEGQHHFNSADALASHIEGSENISNGRFAHVEGRFNEATASSSQAHVEGSYNIVSGISAHAEGNQTIASGKYSHSEGNQTLAEGESSHAGGSHTKATKNNQSVIGKYNNNKTNTLFEVGNGTSDSVRSNAFEVNEDGTATVGKDPVNDMDVATKKYVDSKDALPPVTAADNGKTLKVVSGVWAIAEGGSTAKTATFTIATADWVVQSSGKYQATKTDLTDVKADSIIISDASTYRATCVAQAAGSLTYELDDIPSDVVVKVVIL